MEQYALEYGFSHHITGTKDKAQERYIVVFLVLFSCVKIFLKNFFSLYSNHTSLSSVGAERGKCPFSPVQKGGVMMKPTSFETAIRLQFNTLVKRVVDTTVKDYEKELYRRAKREIPFSELPDIMVESFASDEEYAIEKIVFVACGIEIPVEIGELAAALEKLPEKKRNVLLLSYFEEYSDSVIAELMNVTRNGIYKRRMSALKQMKDILQEEMIDDEY